MDYVTAQDLMSATAPAFETVYIPALQKHAVVVGMSGKARDTFEASLITGKGKKREVKTDNIRAKLAARCLYNKPPTDGGTRLFTDDQADNLGDVRADVLAPIFDIAQRLSGIADADVEELGKE
jgi:hypothetical protein